MTLAVITSIYGDYDQLVDPPEQDGVDEYIAVVDHEHPGTALWRQIIEPRAGLHPRLAAKVAKCCPQLYTGCDEMVWMDGSARLKHAGAARWAVAHLTDDRHVACFRHPDRCDFHHEAMYCEFLDKYVHTSVVQQANYYSKTVGCPSPSGLWASGFMARRIESGRWTGFGERWLAEQVRWSIQDQVSLPYLFWRLGVQPADLEGNLWGNDHVGFGIHLG